MKNKNYWPRVTIGIISCNRLHYLKATIESAKACIYYPNIEWIVIDNASTESGLRDYLESCSFIDHLIFRDERDPQHEHTRAMNEIVELSSGEHIFIWPEDVQFITKGDWLKDYVEILENHEWIGSLGINALRRKTLKRTFKSLPFQDYKKLIVDFKTFGKEFRQQRVFRSKRGMKFFSMGWREEGLIGSGIPSLSRKSMWQTMGPWVSKGARAGLVDSSGGGEDEMLQRWREMRWPLHRVHPSIPVAADIINDNMGCKAKVRGNHRYGVYEKPDSGIFYYELQDLSKFQPYSSISFPIGFEDMVKPVSGKLPLDDGGDLLKASINETIKTPLE